MHPPMSRITSMPGSTADWPQSPKPLTQGDKKIMVKKIKIMKTSESAIIPTRGSDGAIGYDLYADVCINAGEQAGREEWFIRPHESLLVGTGIAFEIPDGYGGFIFARSGLASKEKLRPSNCVGVIDPDYRGELIVSLHNDSEKAKFIKKGERFAQIVIIPCITPELEIATEFTKTKRGENGFGSTGH